MIWRIKPVSTKVWPSPSDARAIPEAITNKAIQRLTEKVSMPSSKPQIIVKTGAPPLRMVPKETVSILRATLEHPISSAVAIPMGRTYSRNCLLVRGWARKRGVRERSRAQRVVRVLEKVVTVRGKEKWLLKSHLVVRMMAEEMQYHDKRVKQVRMRARKRCREEGVTDMVRERGLGGRWGRWRGASPLSKGWKEREPR